MSRFFTTIARLLAMTAAAGLIINCGGGVGGSNHTPPPPGTLTGIVSDALFTPSTPITGAKVTVFEADTNSVVTTLTTSVDGKYRVDLNAGSYYVKVAKQGYVPVPPPALQAVPFAIASGKITTNNVEMFPSGDINIGWISGKVTNGTTGVAGVLVVAISGGAAFSTLSDTNGNYVIYNVPTGVDYSVTGHRAGYSSTTVPSVVVSQSTETPDINLSLTADATGQVPVSFNVISQTGVTPPASMLVALVHPITHETIPGLVQRKPYSSSVNYTLSGVADGDYLVRATYANDTIVVDPDAIVKFGEPSVTVTSGSATPNPVAIKATSAVGVISPTNPMASTAPVPVSASTPPTFIWDAYPSASDYVVEVMDATTGNVVWGGFSDNSGTLVKNVPTTQTSIDYTGPALVVGHVYRWRVYASKDDSTAQGWHLISASEDQRGLIKVQ